MVVSGRRRWIDVDRRGIYFERPQMEAFQQETQMTQMWHGESLHLCCSSMLNRDGVITVSRSVAC